MAGKGNLKFQVMTSASAVTGEKPGASAKVPIQFILLAPQAGQVSVAGTFNQWDADAQKMEKDKRGRWSAKVSLLPGRYEYLFVVDGHWLCDPQAKQSAKNVFGAMNSVVEVG